MADRTSTTNCTRPASTAGTTASVRGKSSPMRSSSIPLMASSFNMLGIRPTTTAGAR